VILEGGWLTPNLEEPPVHRLFTDRTCSLALGRPLGIVWHAIEVPCSPGIGRRLSERIRKGCGKSWHAAIERDGTIYQCAPFTLGTFHTRGVGTFGPVILPVSGSTAGIELANAGRVKKLEGNWYTWSEKFRGWGKDPSCLVRDTDIEWSSSASGYFQRYTDEQITVGKAIAKACGEKWGSCEAYSHAQFDPRRREDPGPFWPMEEMRKAGIPAEAPGG